MSATVIKNVNSPVLSKKNTDSDDVKDRHVLANRYKTKLCRNHVQEGSCPYEHRCMFAHGEHELRTKEMNLQDGLVTEEAIRDFKRARAAAGSRQPARAPSAASSAAAAAIASDDEWNNSRSSVMNVPTNMQYNGHDDYYSYETATYRASALPREECMPSYYQHNPYAASYGDTTPMPSYYNFGGYDNYSSPSLLCNCAECQAMNVTEKAEVGAPLQP